MRVNDNYSPAKPPSAEYLAYYAALKARREAEKGAAVRERAQARADAKMAQGVQQQRKGMSNVG